MKAKGLRFVYDDIQDIIQKSLYHGTFFEEDELDTLIPFIKKNAVIIDVGANIGNHAIYFDKFLSPKIVYVIEPLGRAITMMLQNVALTYSHTINLDYIGVALSDKMCYTIPDTTCEHNLGATTFREILPEENIDLESFGFKTVTGDSIFENLIVDFIKIDVEGMELQVLDGFKETISKNKPIIFIEIPLDHIHKFNKWLSINNYQINLEHKHTGYNNYLISPMEIIL
jgi:FkbM family methyltransferase